jgi:hypothetical protein
MIISTDSQREQEIAGVRCCCKVDRICSGNLRHEVMENEKCLSGEKRKRGN